MSKHYIRTDSNNRVVYGFSDDFEQPQSTDICICEDGGRQFCLLGQINPSLVNLEGIYLYKYENNQVELRTDAELKADATALPPQAPTIEDRIAALEAGFATMMEV
jgi:hypothetical protein